MLPDDAMKAISRGRETIYFLRRCYDYESIVGSRKENQRAPILRSQLGRRIVNFFYDLRC